MSRIEDLSNITFFFLSNIITLTNGAAAAVTLFLNLNISFPSIVCSKRRPKNPPINRF